MGKRKNKTNVKAKKISVSKKKVKNSGEFLREEFSWMEDKSEDEEPGIFLLCKELRRDLWNVIKAFPSLFKATITNKEVIILSIFGAFLGSVGVGILYLFKVLLDYIFKG